MRLLIYTANLGNFDKPQEHVEQELPDGIDQIEYWRCTDEDFPPRFNSMTPRLQARIVKMFGWQMKPDYDIYLWVDSSCKLSRPDSAKWFMEQLGNTDMAVFKHNVRHRVLDEANYLKQRLLDEKAHRKLPYVLPRYENEDINGQMSEVDPNARLYASTAFIYRNNYEIQEVMKRWWYFTSRYHSIDQLGLPEALSNGGYSEEFHSLEWNVIEEDYLRCKYLEYTR